MHDNEIGFGKELNQIIFDITEKYNYPKCFDFPLGHIKENTPIVVGSKVLGLMTKLPIYKKCL